MTDPRSDHRDLIDPVTANGSQPTVLAPRIRASRPGRVLGAARAA